jgi:hypothetical protein
MIPDLDRFHLEVIATRFFTPSIATRPTMKRHVPGWSLRFRRRAGLVRVAGPASDAHLAALAIEHGACLIPTDSDFAALTTFGGATRSFSAESDRAVRPLRAPLSDESAARRDCRCLEAHQQLDRPSGSSKM